MNLTDRLNKWSLVRRSSLQSAKEQINSFEVTRQTTIGQTVSNLADEYSIEDTGFRHRALSSKVPIVSVYRPCNLTILSARSSKSSNRLTPAEIAQASHQVKKVQDKIPLSFSNLLTAPVPKLRPRRVVQASAVYSCQNTDLVRRVGRTSTHMMGLPTRKRPSLINTDHGIRLNNPKLQLLAESPKVTPHPGDKDIPLITDHVGMLVSRLSLDECKLLRKVTLELRSVDRMDETRAQ